MYKKWLGWKKVAVCLVGAAMIMQGGSLAMAADEYPTEQDGPDYAEDDQTSEDTTEDTDEDTSDEDTDEDDSDADQDAEDADSDEDSDSTADVLIDPEETPEESEDVIAAEEDGEDAEAAGLLMTGTVSHIDLARVAEATLTVGDKTLTQTVIFDEGDLGNISVDPDYAGAIVLGEGQIHIAGVFPVGTFGDRVQYTVSITKDVTFTDPETGATYTQTMTFTSSFNYWDDSNMCPSLGYREYWSNGFVIPWSGMDFCFGSASATIPGPTAVPEPTATPTATPAPVEPTGTPVEPTATPVPVEPTGTPVEPTATPVPVEPTGTPVEPTATPVPVEPTGTPVEPTATPVPVEPTGTPVEPTATPVPVEPTGTPVEPTATPVPVEPTGTPVEPTETPAPVDPTETPVDPDVTVTPDPTETPVDPDVTETPEDPDATATPTPTATGTTTGTNGGNGSSTNGTSSNGTTTSGSQKSNQVKTADNTKVAGSAFMFAFALFDVVLAFFALHLKRRRDK